MRFNNNLIRGFYQMTTSSSSGQIDLNALANSINRLHHRRNNNLRGNNYTRHHNSNNSCRSNSHRSVLFYGGLWLTFGLFGLLSILYFIILDVVWGGTIGKRLMGLQVQTGKRRQEYQLANHSSAT